MLIQKGIKDRINGWWDCRRADRPCILCYDLRGIDHEFDINKYWTDHEYMMSVNLKRMAETKYFGEAIPFHYVDFGASVMAGILGSPMLSGKLETLWAEPYSSSIGDIVDLFIDEESTFYKKVYKTLELSANLSKENFLVGSWCLGSPLDTASSLIGAENLLLSLAMEGDLAKQSLQNLNKILLSEWEKTKDIILSYGQGMTGWHGIYAQGSTFPIQDDFSCMISSEMFDEFSLPYTKEYVNGMDYPFYHLDGPDALHHLDTLIEIQNLPVIQWQPGVGRRKMKEWIPLCKKILASGKSIQLYAEVDEISELTQLLGGKGLLLISIIKSDEDANFLFNKFGIKENKNINREWMKSKSMELRGKSYE